MPQSNIAKPTSALRIVWAIAMNLVALFVVLALFKVARSQFETVVICALALIYVEVEGSFADLAFAVLEFARSHDAQFLELARLLNHPSIEDYKESLDGDTNMLRKTSTRYLISNLFRFVIWAITTWKLVTALDVI